MARTIAKDHDNKRLLILTVAAEMFATQGIARASMSQLATACGMSKANIYHYYDSKDALLFDILDNYLSVLRNRLLALPLDWSSPDDSLRMIIRETLMAYDGMDHEHKIQTEGLPLLNAAQQQVLKGYQRDMVGLLSDVIAQTAPATLADDPVKLRATTMSVFGMLNWFYMWNGHADQSAREDYANLVTDLTIAGARGL